MTAVAATAITAAAAIDLRRAPAIEIASPKVPNPAVNAATAIGAAAPLPGIGPSAPENGVSGTTMEGFPIPARRIKRRDAARHALHERGFHRGHPGALAQLSVLRLWRPLAHDYWGFLNSRFTSTWS
jgi:hypothetical protein